jgi:hypothetical protein
VKRLLTRSLPMTVLALGLALGVSSPALALDTNPPPDTGGSGIPPVTSGGSSDSGGSRTDSRGSCRVVSTPSFLGLSCGRGDLTNESVGQILGSDPVPDCWDEKLTQQELDLLSYQNGESTWYWHRCLKGINPKTKKIGPDGVSFTIELRGVKPGEQVVTLTHNQQVLVALKDTNGMIPAPVAGISPSARPRVGSDVSFFDGTEHEVGVNAGGFSLQAHVVSLKVEPVGKGLAPLLRCRGVGYVAKRGDTPRTHPGCWHRYAASSADQTDNAYPVNITAHWVVELNGEPFNEFDKSQVTNVPVTEIEALVVP